MPSLSSTLHERASLRGMLGFCSDPTTSKASSSSPVRFRTPQSFFVTAKEVARPRPKLRLALGVERLQRHMGPVVAAIPRLRYLLEAGALVHHPRPVVHRIDAGLDRQSIVKCCGAIDHKAHNCCKLSRAPRRIRRHVRCQSEWRVTPRSRGWGLDTKNDESRFGLTRAPFLERHVRLSVTKVITCRRAARNGLLINWVRASGRFRGYYAYQSPCLMRFFIFLFVRSRFRGLR